MESIQNLMENFIMWFYKLSPWKAFGPIILWKAKAFGPDAVMAHQLDSGQLIDLYLFYFALVLKQRVG
jgi:hypothetical protein